MVPSRKPVGKCRQATALQDARKTIEALRDVSRFQTSLIDRLEKAVEAMRKSTVAE